jgi:hypothetical protein
MKLATVLLCLLILPLAVAQGVDLRADEISIAPVPAISLPDAPQAPAPTLPTVPGATSQAPIAVGGFLKYDAQPIPGSKHSTGGLFFLYPAANTTTGHPTFARMSIDVSSVPKCKGCLGTSFRFGLEQQLFQTGSFITAAGADVGVFTGASATTGSFGFDIREAYAPAAKKWFYFVSVGGEQNGGTGLLSKFEGGVGYKF